MNLTCDDVNARLVDLVYGEGDASTRQALQEHVDGCARCQADLEALGRTRATVRAQLGEAPPAGVRARILEAAAEALAGGAQIATASATATGAAPSAAPAPGRPPKSRTEEARGGSPSFWAWLRGHWQWPTLATAGALAVMLLGSKVFLNPDRTYERGREVTAAPAAAPQPTPVPAVVRAVPAAPSVAGPAPTAPAEAAPAPSMAWEEKSASLDRVSEAAKAARAERHKAVRHLAAAAARSEGSPPRDKDTERGRLDNLLESSGRTYAQPPRGVAGGGAPAGKPLAGKGDLYRMEDAAPRAANAAPAAEVAEQERMLSKETVTAAHPAKKAPKREAADELLEGFAGGVGSGSARAQAAPVARTEAAEGKAKAAPKPTARITAASAPPPAAAPSPPPAPPPPSLEELTRRADRLFAEQRWEEATLAYQELLRRYPAADAVPRWRARVVEARRARLAAEPAARPPKASAADVAAPAAAESK